MNLVNGYYESIDQKMRVFLIFSKKKSKRAEIKLCEEKIMSTISCTTPNNRNKNDTIHKREAPKSEGRTNKQ